MDEEYNSIETTCTNCKLNFKLKDLKINPETEKLICTNCFSYPNSRIIRIR